VACVPVSRFLASVRNETFNFNFLDPFEAFPFDDQRLSSSQ
jgi:hypothetical protein